MAYYVFWVGLFIALVVAYGFLHQKLKRLYQEETRLREIAMESSREARNKRVADEPRLDSIAKLRGNTDSANSGE